MGSRFGDKTLKPNRSNIFTDGLCNTFTNHEGHRSLFFELDNPSGSDIIRVIESYVYYRLDFVAHLTGGGIHFLSPTVLIKEDWKEAISTLKDLNTKCPMTTLRTQANKHENEASYFYKPLYSSRSLANYSRNSMQLCKILNDLFRMDFAGIVDAEPKKVRYPLPCPA